MDPIHSIVVRFEHEDQYSVQGRNGQSHCTGIKVYPGKLGTNQSTTIGFLNSRDVWTNAGAVVPSEAFEEVAIQFLAERGYCVTKEVKREVQSVR